MIYSLQKRFIKITAFSIGIVFAVIFTVIALLSFFQLNRGMDMLTDILSENGGSFPEPDQDVKPENPPRAPGELGPETMFSIRFFAVWTDDDGKVIRENTEQISSVSETEIQEYAEKAARAGKERGWTEGYRYKKTDTEYGNLIIFVNGETNTGMTRQILYTVFLVLTASFLCILLLIILISKRAVRPVAEAFEKQKQFVTDANHELKTPLTLILSNLDIIEAETGKNEWLDDIRSEGERMGELIGQLVMLSRMDEDTSDIISEVFDLSAMATDVVSEFENLSAEKGKNLSADITDGIFYQGDEGMIRRLLSVLLDNAVKYCDPKGSICVRVYYKGRHPVISVENTYADVDSIPLNRLFDRFYRADKARTYSGNFGVGLSIAKGIAQKHKGDITAYRKEPGIIGFRAVLK